LFGRKDNPCGYNTLLTNCIIWWKRVVHLPLRNYANRIKHESVHQVATAGSLFFRLSARSWDASCKSKISTLSDFDGICSSATTSFSPTEYVASGYVGACSVVSKILRLFLRGISSSSYYLFEVIQ